MGAKTKTGKGRLDKFYYLAKEQGYRSRAAFKLVQLNRKYGFLEKARTLLDLCAAPGGWLQIAAKTMPMSSLIVGVDLAPIRPIRGCITLMEDITTAKCRAAIKRELKSSLLDVVLHDGSPNVGGAWSSEAYTQSALSLEALKLATELLVPGGTFVSKIFRSQDYNALLFALNQLFDRVEATKPVASRNTSAEIYVVCRGYKAPAKIDPRLLDAKHLFQQAEEAAPKPVDVLRESKQKRHRDGYEEGTSLVHKGGLAAAFIKTDSPVEFLGTYTSLAFSGPEGQRLLAHPATDAEVRALCEDLKVLGKREFKALLKWRIAVRQQDKEEQGPAEEEAKPKEEEEEGADSEREEAGVLGEMAELRAVMEAKKKKARKVAAKKKEKARARTATGMSLDALGEGEGVYADEELFALGSIKSGKGLAKVVPDDEEGAGEGGEEDEMDTEEGADEGAADEDGEEEDDLDEDAEEKRHMQMLEEYLETAYDEYRKRSGLKSKAADRRQRKRLATESDAGPEQDEEEAPAAVAEAGSDSDTESEDEEGGANPLVVGLSRAAKPSKEQLAQQWFSQSVFGELPGAGGDEARREAPAKRTRQEREEAASSESEEDEEVEAGPRTKRRKNDGVTKAAVTAAGSGGHSNGARADEAAAEAGGFEEVAAAASASDSSEDEADVDGYDTDDKAETLAYAHAMIRKKGREGILDEAYNRYTFNDDELPVWFKNEERKHMQPIKPVTKEEIEAYKAQFRSIDTRTPKKVAEAKARKRGRLLKKMEQVRQKANSIADGADMNNRSKAKMIEKLYAKAAPKHVKKEVAVTKSKAVGPSGAKGKRKVDKRMKADMRQRNTGGAVNRKGQLVGRGGRAKKGAKGKGGRPAKKAGGKGGKAGGKGGR